MSIFSDKNTNALFSHLHALLGMLGFCLTTIWSYVFSVRGFGHALFYYMEEKMKNKIAAILLMLCMLFNFVACDESETNSKREDLESLKEHVHTYSDATCTSPKMCSCGETVGVELGHAFTKATCTSPKICSRCGTTEGSELGHDFLEATCAEAQKCSRCEEQTGEALGHTYVDGKCSRCGSVDPDSIPVSLNEVHVIDSGEYEYSSNSYKDSFGNVYEGYYEYSPGKNGWAYSIFNLNKQYSKLQGTIIVRDGSPSDGEFSVMVYVDNNLVCTKSGITKTSGKFDFEVDVKNTQQLNIKVTRTAGNGYSREYNSSFAIVDAKLFK